MRIAMSRSIRSDGKLVSICEHLHYEIISCLGFAGKQFSKSILERVKANALIDSCSMHSRNLKAFLYCKNPSEDDVIAEDFVVDWAKRRPTEPSSIQLINQRVGKEVAHLTYARLDVTQAAKPWPFIQTAKDIEEVLKVFLSFVPVNKLDPRMKDLKENVFRTS
jgi:hypothetical protein